MRTASIIRFGRKLFAGVVVAMTLVASLAHPASAQERGSDNAQRYQDAIANTEAMVWDQRVIELAAQYGLDVVNVAWEDTGRYDNSSVGPNISDVTIQVARPIAGSDEHTLSLMPVIRHPNFTDKTGDVEIDNFYLPVGNEVGEALRLVTLQEYLGNIDRYLSDGGEVYGRLSLLAERDTHVLVSAQTAFLPVPEQGIAEFNPVIFNYQSSAANPAVLTIVVTAEGTSATIIDNQRDGFDSGSSWGQRLFFNQDGERASLTGERASEVAGFDAEAEFANTSEAGPGVEAERAGGTGEHSQEDSNVVLIIQVPLKHEGFELYDYADSDCLGCSFAMESAAASDVEDAVIGHGAVEGPFTELAGLAIERDPDFPVRVTVQYYKATATGEVSAADMEAVAVDIERVYTDAEYVGSLVTDGLTGRPTEYVGQHDEPHGWWGGFFARFSELLPA